MTWQPTATIETLKQRAEIIAKIRDFFAKRQVLEVETPLLCSGSVPSPYIESFQVGNKYLQTSPEFLMKRLLAAGSGSIYQIGKVFRLEESGRLHNPEFTLLEWYRVGFDHRDLMKEVNDLLQMILHCEPCEAITYQALFEKYLQINPHAISESELKACARAGGLTTIELQDKDDWLNLLLTHFIEPHLGVDKPCFVYDYPVSQSALAKIQIRDDGIAVAERFEVYCQGIELGNGFHELADSQEQLARFEAELVVRKVNHQHITAIDRRFVESLDHLPACAGVALGIDRIIMLVLGKKSIKEVMSFDFQRA